AGGSLLMAADARLVTAGGSQRLVAGTGVVLGQVAAGSGLVAISTGGSIADADAAGGTQTVNIAAGGVQLSAAGGIGSGSNALETSINTLAVRAITGGVFVAEGNGLEVGSVAAVGASGALAGAQGGGSVVITSGNTHEGRLTVNEDIAANTQGGSGNVLIAVNTAALNQPSLQLNANVDAGSGALSFVVQGSIAQAAGSGLTTSGGSIDVRAVGGSLTQADGAQISSGGGNVRLQSDGDLTASLVDAGSGAVSLVSGGSILDADNTGANDIAAGSVRLQAAASIGSAGNALDVLAGAVAAQAGSSLNLASAASLAVGSSGVIGVGVVNADGSVTANGLTDAALAGATAATNLQLRAANNLVMADAERITAGGTLALVAGGNIALGDVRTLGAAVIVADGSVLDGDAATDVTAASLLLQAGGAAGTASAPIEIAVGQLATSAAGLAIAQTGALTVGSLSASLSVDGAAAQALQAGGLASSQALQIQVGNGDLHLDANATTQGGNLGITVSGGSLLMAGGSIAGSQGGAITLAASGDVVLGQADAGAGSVGVTAGGDVRVASGAPATQLLGSTASLSAGGGIAGVHAGVDNLQLAATGAVSVANAGDLTLTGAALNVSDLTLQVSGNLNVQQSITAAGNMALQSSGATAVQAAVHADHLLLAIAGTTLTTSAALTAGTGISLASGGDMTLGGDVGTTSGPVSIASGRDLAVNGRLSSAASLDAQAQRDIVFASSASAEALAALRVQAGGDIRLGSLSSATAVSLIAGGSIVGQAGDHVDVTAPALRLVAGNGIGSDAERLQTQVATVSARAGSGGIWLLEADAVTVDDVSVSVTHLSTTGQASTVTDAVQSDLITSANGSIGLRTLAGGIVLNDGSAPANGVAVKADGSGQVSLQAQGPGAVLDVPAQTINQDGDVVLDSHLALQGDLVINAGQGAGSGGITLTGAVDGQAGGPADTLALHADGGAVTVLGAVGATMALGGLLVDGATDVSFASSVHLTGDLTVHASGSVEFHGDLQLDGGSLHIVGATRVVLNGVVIAQGDLVIDGASSLTLGNSSVAHGNVVLGVDALTLNGPLTSAGGALTIQPTATGRAISLAESGDGLLLSAATLANLRGFGAVKLETAGQVLVSTDTLSALAATGLDISGSSFSLQGGSAGLQFTDHLALRASGDVAISGGMAFSAAGADFSIDSRGALKMAPGSRITTNGGDVTALADTGITLGRIDTGGTGTGGVLLQALTGNIVDADNDDTVNVHAAWLSLRGHGPALTPGTSTTAAAIDVAVDRLDADDTRGLMLRDTGADGRTRFNLLDNGVLYQQVVADGSPLRGSTAPIVQGIGGTAADRTAQMAAWLQALRPLAELRQGSLLDGPTRHALSALASTDADLPRDSAASVYLATLTGTPAADATTATDGVALNLLSDASFGLAQSLERAWLLGSGSQQPAASGLRAVADTAFDTWEESLAL
ncbi:MAG TPA: hypothetical protein VIN58_12280, partial [Roseateles sp.]